MDGPWSWLTASASQLLIRFRSPMYTLWLFNIAMENDPFTNKCPIKTFIYEGFSMAMLNNQMDTRW